MIRLLALLVFLFCFVSESTSSTSTNFTNDPTLAVSNIPLQLLVNANAVIRHNNVVHTVKDLDDVQSTVDCAVTVVNSKGQSAGTVSIGYSETIQKVKDLKISIYDANGELIKKIKKKDIQNVAVYDGFSIANDYRRFTYEHLSNSYPYTVKYSYTKTNKNSWLLPSWWPITYYNTSVQSSTMKMITNVDGHIIKQKAKNMERISDLVEITDGYLQASNLTAIKYERLSPSSRDAFPHVSFVANEFEFYDIKGKIANWKEYGKWAYDNLLSDRGELPEELINEVDQLIPTGASKEEIARIIYHYVTNSTRYVSVQLGIGGLQPFKCSDVFSWKYGDCKALTFYTQNLLEHYDVESIYMEINLNSDYNVSYDKSWPSIGQGNHVALCLPNDGDTLFLECTSPLVFGYTHDGINNRNALLIKKDGGQVIRTTRYGPEDNRSVREIKVSGLLDDQVKVEQIAKHRNARYEKYRGYITMEGKKKEKFVKGYLYPDYPSFEIVHHQVSIDSSEVLAIEEAEFTSKHMIEKAGYYIMLPMSIASVEDGKTLSKKRVNDIHIKDDASDLVVLEVKIPSGYQFVPSEKLISSFENEFGSINCKVDHSLTAVTIQIEIERISGTFDSSKVEVYNSYLQAVRDITNQKLTFKPT